MNKPLIKPVLMLLLLIIVTTVNSQITWPGEKKFAGYTNLDQLKNVFAQDTSAYGRRYLIQALPFFVEKNKITSTPPAWLVREISRAVVSDDPELALEGILTTKKLNIHSLSDTLVKVYRKVRMRWVGQRPQFHMLIVRSLVDFNDPASRKALMNIAATPLPPTIAEDVVPALKGVNKIGDSSCVNALSILSARLHSSQDSIAALQGNQIAAVDTATANKLGRICSLVDKIKKSVQVRGSVR
jgi:hypothetical protein